MKYSLKKCYIPKRAKIEGVLMPQEHSCGDQIVLRLINEK